MTDRDDDDTVARRSDEATVVSRRRGSGTERSEGAGGEASETAEDTVLRPRTAARASVREEPAAPPSPHRRTASSGQPENTVYRPRPADPVIVPRTQR